MTGLGDKVVSRLLETGLVRFGLPLDALQFHFPYLYLEAATRLDEEKIAL